VALYERLVMLVPTSSSSSNSLKPTDFLIEISFSTHRDFGDDDDDITQFESEADATSMLPRVSFTSMSIVKHISFNRLNEHRVEY